MSDRRAWLEEPCPECRAPPGARCRVRSFKRRQDPARRLHTAWGWRQRRCPTCRAMPDELCRTPSGRQASRPHTARLQRGRGELVGAEVWEELQRRGATLAFVPFSGRAGIGGRIGTITLSRVEAGGLVDVERWGVGRDELAHALEAPVWDRFGSFAGQSWVRGTVTWELDRRRVVIDGDRAGARFEEIVA